MAPGFNRPDWSNHLKTLNKERRFPFLPHRRQGPVLLMPRTNQPWARCGRQIIRNFGALPQTLCHHHERQHWSEREERAHERGHVTAGDVQILRRHVLLAQSALGHGIFNRQRHRDAAVLLGESFSTRSNSVSNMTEGRSCPQFLSSWEAPRSGAWPLFPPASRRSFAQCYRRHRPKRRSRRTSPPADGDERAPRRDPQRLLTARPLEALSCSSSISESDGGPQAGRSSKSSSDE